MKSVGNEGEERFSILLEQIESSASQKYYFVAIMASLAIPDIGGAIDSSIGKANKINYMGWFDKYAAPKFRGFGELRLTGKECFFLRCSMLHQGNMQQKELKNYSDIIFTEIPQMSTSFPLFLTKSKILLIEPNTFCNNMVYAAYDWLEVAHNEEIFKKNSENFMTLFSLSFPGLPE